MSGSSMTWYVLLRISLNATNAAGLPRIPSFDVPHFFPYSSIEILFATSRSLVCGVVAFPSFKSDRMTETGNGGADILSCGRMKMKRDRGSVENPHPGF